MAIDLFFLNQYSLNVLMVEQMSQKQGSENVLGIIPARYSSTRFPGKPLAKILNKSLIQWTYENAKRSPVIKELVVATDDQRIYDHVKAFGGEAVMTASHWLTGTDRMCEVIENNPRFQHYAIVVNIQGDEPCLNPACISDTVALLQGDSEAHMATPVSPLRDPKAAENSSLVKCVMDLHGNALYFSRALIPAGRDLNFKNNVAYFRHIGLYAFRKDFLLKYATLPATPLQLAEDLEQLKVLENGYRIKVAVVESQSIDVNHPEDIQKVERYLCTLNSSS